MARQALGSKKRNRVASKLGMPVAAAFVDSVWGRGWCEAFITADTSFLINIKTGDFTQLFEKGQAITSSPVWRRRGCCA